MVYKSAPLYDIYRESSQGVFSSSFEIPQTIPQKIGEKIETSIKKHQEELATLCVTYTRRNLSSMF